MSDSRFDLQRFVDAQRDTYGVALIEVSAGEKRSPWMWFIFPQLRGLGRSSTAQHYGLASLDEAKAYLSHPALGARLIEITQAATSAPAASLNDLFGSPDDMKFRSSMTVFERAAGQDDNPFRQALERWFNGRRDPATLDLLAQE